MAPPKKRLGDILLEMGAVDALQLRSALGHHQQWGMPLGRTLVERRICSVEQVLAALARQTGLPVVHLDDHPLERAPIRLVPRHLAERHRMIPLALEGSRNECLVVAAAAPVGLDDLDAVCSASGKIRIRALLAADDALERAIVRLYGRGEAEAEARATGVPVHGLPPADEVTFGFDTPVPQQDPILGLAPANEVTFGFEAAPPDEPAEELPAAAEVTFGFEAAPRAEHVQGRSAADEVTFGFEAAPQGAHAQGRPVPDEVTFGFDTPSPQGAPNLESEAAAASPSSHGVAEGRGVAGEAPDPHFVPGRVLLYGWSGEVSSALATALAGGGVQAETVDAQEVLAAGGDDVVISSTLALEALLGPRDALAPRVIICGTPDRSDMAAAKALGARIYLPPPFSVVQLGVSVRRCHEAAARRRRRRSR